MRRREKKKRRRGNKGGKRIIEGQVGVGRVRGDLEDILDGLLNLGTGNIRYRRRQ
jgi:hypothetical protein